MRLSPARAATAALLTFIATHSELWAQTIAQLPQKHPSDTLSVTPEFTLNKQTIIPDTAKRGAYFSYQGVNDQYYYIPETPTILTQAAEKKERQREKQDRRAQRQRTFPVTVSGSFTTKTIGSMPQ